jgi:hypothetical protein
MVSCNLRKTVTPGSECEKPRVRRSCGAPNPERVRPPHRVPVCAENAFHEAMGKSSLDFVLATAWPVP